MFCNQKIDPEHLQQEHPDPAPYLAARSPDSREPSPSTIADLVSDECPPHRASKYFSNAGATPDPRVTNTLPSTSTSSRASWARDSPMSPHPTRPHLLFGQPIYAPSYRDGAQPTSQHPARPRSSHRASPYFSQSHIRNESTEPSLQQKNIDRSAQRETYGSSPSLVPKDVPRSSQLRPRNRLERAEGQFATKLQDRATATLDAQYQQDASLSFFARPDPPQTPSIEPPMSSMSMPSDNTILGKSHHQDFSETESEHSRAAASTISRPTTSYTSRGVRATPFPPTTEASHVICALSEAKGVTPSVGAAFVNVSTSEVILTQISDSQFYSKTLHKLQVLEPSRILLLHSAGSSNAKSHLLPMVREHVTNAQVVLFDRKHWTEEAGEHYLDTLAPKEDAETIKVAIRGNYYTTCAFSAIVTYIDLEMAIKVVPHSLRVRFEPSENTMLIDVSAIQSLELLRNQSNPKSKETLFGLLNHTQTPMGARVLRSNILQPSTCLEPLLALRYEALDELATSEEMFVEARKALKSFPDAERVLTKLVLIPKKAGLGPSETAINDIILIKTFLDAISKAYEALAPAKSNLLYQIREICAPVETKTAHDMIRNVIQDDIALMKTALDMRNSRAFAIKSGINDLLDVARYIYKESTENIHTYVASLNSELGVEAQLKYDPSRKYWLRYRANSFEDELPEVLINRIEKRGFIECLTLQLKKLNARVQNAFDECLMLGDEIIQQLLQGLREQIQPMFRVCDAIGLLDMMTSFAHAATLRDYVRPDITGTLALKAARHPIMDMQLEDHLVRNDIYSTEEYRFKIITGCNMSGKTTYIRTVALLQIMAQIGCFVPAQYAAFPIIESVFVRASTDDDSTANMSTFSLEMREMAFILRNITHKSLVIVDELGRGTSTRDGLSIAIAMAEALIQSRASVWFVTHFHDIADVLGDRPGVMNLHLASKVESRELANGGNEAPRLKMLYSVETGKVSNEHYGLILAREVGLPEEFLKNAEEVALSLQKQNEASQDDLDAWKVVSRRRLVLQLHEQLKLSLTSGLEDARLAKYLQQLQEEFIVQMAAVEEGQGFLEDPDTRETSEEACETTAEDGSDVEFDSEGIDDTVLGDAESLSSKL